LSDDEVGAMRSLISRLDGIAPDKRAPLQLLLEAGDTELTQGIRQLETRLFANSRNGIHGDAGPGGSSTRRLRAFERIRLLRKAQ